MRNATTKKVRKKKRIFSNLNEKVTLAWGLATIKGTLNPIKGRFSGPSGDRRSHRYLTILLMFYAHAKKVAFNEENSDI